MAPIEKKKTERSAKKKRKTGHPRPQKKRQKQSAANPRPVSSKKKKLSRPSTAQAADGKKKKRRPAGRKSSSKRFKRSRRIGLQLLLSLFLTILLVWVVSLFTFTFHRVDSYMMAPALNNKDTVFVNKVKKIRRFDLVLIKNKEDGSTSIRRVIGVGGDQLYYKNDQLYLNNEEQVERFLSKQLEEAHQNDLLLTEDFSLKQATGEESVPKNSYFVLGDNRHYASDGRHYGLITDSEVIGVVQLRILPLHEMQYL